MFGNFGASLACVESMHVAKPEWVVIGVFVHVPKPFWGWFQSLLCWHRYFGMNLFAQWVLNHEQPWINNSWENESWSLYVFQSFAGMWIQRTTFKPKHTWMIICPSTFTILASSWQFYYSYYYYYYYYIFLAHTPKK
jgi:hypothetical protein